MPLTPEQKAIRRTGIGGSDAAAICNRHPSKTSLDVWMEKAWERESPQGEWAEWGQLLEPVIAAKAAERLGLQLRVPTETVCHPEHPWMLANLDGELLDEQGRRVAILETKNISQFKADRLGEENSDEVLEEHLFQVQHYLEVTGAEFAVVAYLVGGNTLRLFNVRRNRAFGEALVAIEGAFWRDHVLADVPPESTDLAAVREYLARRFPRDNGTEIAAEGSARDLLADLREAIAHRKAAELREAAAANAVKAVLGDATSIACDFGRVTWRANKKGARVFRPTFAGDEAGNE